MILFIDDLETHVDPITAAIIQKEKTMARLIAAWRSSSRSVAQINIANFDFKGTSRSVNRITLLYTIFAALDCAVSCSQPPLASAVLLASACWSFVMLSFFCWATIGGLAV